MDINSLRERHSSETMTVTDLNEFIKNIFDSNKGLTSVTVKGEISNFVYHRSGHMYFSLKDADSQIRAVMFRSSALKLKFVPENGMKVIIHGAVSVYTRDGSYQLYSGSMQPDGVGALYLAYEQLKSKLAAEGLFDESVKKAIPRFPSKIGVITSPSGAAVRDIINVIGRRYPLADIYLYPALVQGDGAEESLCIALDYFDKSGLADVVIIGRGGGSIEDLWAFNSEKLARMIYATAVPVISAVGHETDFTICDFVSDLRAPTPSAAAELAVPDIRELNLTVDSYFERLDSGLLGLLSGCRTRLNAIMSREIMRCPFGIFENRRDKTDRLTDKLNDLIAVVLTECQNKIKVSAGRLEALNPLSVLRRGFSIAEFEGKTVFGVSDVKPGDVFKLRLSDGTINAEVITTEKEIEK